MSVTVLAAAFLLMMIALTVFGYRAISRKARQQKESGGREKCSVCRSPHPRGALVEREVGDYRVLWFCRDCIAALAADAAAPGRSANGGGGPAPGG